MCSGMQSFKKKNFPGAANFAISGHRLKSRIAARTLSNVHSSRVKIIIKVSFVYAYIYWANKFYICICERVTFRVIEILLRLCNNMFRSFNTLSLILLLTRLENVNFIEKQMQRYIIIIKINGFFFVSFLKVVNF